MTKAYIPKVGDIAEYTFLDGSGEPEETVTGVVVEVGMTYAEVQWRGNEGRPERIRFRAKKGVTFRQPALDPEQVPADEGSEMLAACIQSIYLARTNERMYQRAADRAPDDAVRQWNQQRADWAGDRAATCERWLEENYPYATSRAVDAYNRIRQGGVCPAEAMRGLNSVARRLVEAALEFSKEVA